jgi:hypothetical protein
MRKLALLAASLFCANLAWGAAYTASASGDWSNAATWGGAGIPGNGDTVTINDGVTVTVSTSITVGASATSLSTLAINAQNTGVLHIVSGGSLTARGPITYAPNGGSNTSAYLIVDGGGTLTWDSSQASSPTHYFAGFANTNYGFRPVQLNGTSSNWVNVTSVIDGHNGVAGYFGWNNAAVGGSITGAYVHFTNIGDTSQQAIQTWASSANGMLAYSIQHSTFTNCGQILQQSVLGAADTFQHDYNVHTGSLGGTVLNVGYSNAGGGPVPTTGVREVIGNVFDVDADQTGDYQGFTIHSNYFGAGLGIAHAATDAWWYFQNNFYRDPQSSAGEMMLLAGDARDNLWFLDEHTSFNPHGIDLAGLTTQTISGNIVDHAGQITQVSAFMITNGANLASGNYNFLNNIHPPNAVGHQSFWLTTPIQIGSNTTTYTLNHNTWMTDTIFGTGGGTGIYTQHSGTADPAGTLASYQNNILWNPVTSNEAYKLFAYSGVGNNVCLPANCNYNDGWNTLTGGGGYSGGANGYADIFTGGTPGTHDLAVNPNFVDATRNVATFDSAYLGNTAPTWNSSATYLVGQMVSSASSTIYSSTAIGFPSTGAVINYRYTNGNYQGTACGGANPQPGLLANLSRACWEWATLYDLRQAVGSSTTTSACPGTGIRGTTAPYQCLYNDQTIGAHDVDLITTLIQWIRAGFSPKNPALSLAGSDGQDIGAVPVTFDPATFPGSSGSGGGSILRGIGGRRAIFR